MISRGRKIYRPYYETPMKGKPLLTIDQIRQMSDEEIAETKKAFAKQILKRIAFGTAIAIGVTVTAKLIANRLPDADETEANPYLED